MIEELSSGTIVAGRYRVERLIGKGGMGIVYLAIHESLQRKVALKILRPEIGMIESLKARFEVEAKAASRLNHSGTAVIYDFGEWNGRLFMAMEYVIGQGLDVILPKMFPFSAKDIIVIIAQVCKVLHAAHISGVLHRDIKPENIIILDATQNQWQLKVVDFGVAFMLDGTVSRLTLEGTTLGTPAYMSPEQGMGKQVDARADVYSIGVVLYELLCGHLPFDGNPSEILVKHLYEDPLPPNERNPSVTVHPRLSEIAMMCLKKNPEHRPNTAAELSLLVENALNSNPYVDLPVRTQKKISRLERALDQGLQLPAAPTLVMNQVEIEDVAILVVERISEFDESATALLRANGFSVSHIQDIDAIFESTQSNAAHVIVLHIFDAPEKMLENLNAVLNDTKISASNIIVVGPADSFQAMSRALELGVADYIPLPSLSSKLVKSVVRVSKRRR